MSCCCTESLIVEFSAPDHKWENMPFFGRRQAPVREEMITAQFPNPKSAQISPNNVSLSSYRTPTTLEEALLRAPTPPRTPPHLTHSKTSSASSSELRHPLERSQSSEYFLEIKRSPAPKAPVSRKSAWGRTIRTEAPGEDAFESDAFAVEMPTTREPIVDVPKEASVFRAKIPHPSQAQVDAYQTYKQKAHQVRERNSNEGVKVPSKIVSYDYAYSTRKGQPATAPLHVDLTPPDSPPRLSPAGSFPASPPVAQHAWATSAAAQQSRNRSLFSGDLHAQNTRSISDTNKIAFAKKPAGLGSNTPSKLAPRYRGGDSITGASSSLSGSPPKIKVRIVPKSSTAQTLAHTHNQTHHGLPQKETWWALYNRSPPTSSAESSRPSSPEKHTQFAYTTSAGQQVKATNDTVFGYTTDSIKGTPAPVKRTFAEILKDREKKKMEQKRTLASRWAWLRPTGPRVAKPTPSSVPATAPAPRPMSKYVDPFEKHSTPPPPLIVPLPSRSASPKKIARPETPPASGANPKGKFDSGFAQITSFFGLIFKVCLILYALVAVYFVLDAVREAVHALGAPFRLFKIVGRYAWIVLLWSLKWMAKGWERWGFRIALKGGWRSLARRWW